LEILRLWRSKVAVAFAPLTCPDDSSRHSGPVVSYCQVLPVSSSRNCAPFWMVASVGFWSVLRPWKRCGSLISSTVKGNTPLWDRNQVVVAALPPRWVGVDQASAMPALVRRRCRATSVWGRLPSLSGASSSSSSGSVFLLGLSSEAQFHSWLTFVT